MTWLRVKIWILHYCEDEKKTRETKSKRKRVAREPARRLSPPSPSHFKCSWHLRTPVFFSPLQYTHKQQARVHVSAPYCEYKRKNEIARIYTHGSYSSSRSTIKFRKFLLLFCRSWIREAIFFSIFKI